MKEEDQSDQVFNKKVNLKNSFVFCIDIFLGVLVLLIIIIIIIIWVIKRKRENNQKGGEIETKEINNDGETFSLANAVDFTNTLFNKNMNDEDPFNR